MIKLLPLQGVLLIAIIPRAMPWARSFWAFSPFLNHMRKFSYLIQNCSDPRITYGFHTDYARISYGILDIILQRYEKLSDIRKIIG